MVSGSQFIIRRFAQISADFFRQGYAILKSDWRLDGVAWFLFLVPFGSDIQAWQEILRARGKKILIELEESLLAVGIA